MKVKCIRGYNHQLLEGKIYNVIDEDSVFYYLETDDFGRKNAAWYKHRFVEVEYKLRKINIHKYLSLYDVLNNFSRDELRKYAREHNIPRGRDKTDTIDNIIDSDKLCLNISLGD